MIITEKKSSSLSKNAFYNNNSKKPKRPEAENKNSILNKFRFELNKSQEIITKELLRSKDLNLKFLKKRKKQQAEEEAKQLLIKNSPQNLNLINIQNNLINNSTGFKHKTTSNLNDSQNKKNDSPVKINGFVSENTMNNTNSFKKTMNTYNNTKEDFFATEVKVNTKNNLKNPPNPMKDKKIERNLNMNNTTIIFNDNSPATSRNNNVLIYSEKYSELNQTTPKEYLSNASNKK